MKAEELTFVRSLNAKKGDTIITSFISSPYIVGMYVIIDNDPAMQLSFDHEPFKKWVNKTIKKMEKNGYTVKTVVNKYADYLKIEDINKYILKSA